VCLVCPVGHTHGPCFRRSVAAALALSWPFSLCAGPLNCEPITGPQSRCLVMSLLVIIVIIVVIPALFPPYPRTLSATIRYSPDSNG
jgi:hypothetical protein